MKNKKSSKVISLLAIVAILLAATGCGGGAKVGELQTESQSVELGDAESVRVAIAMGAGELAVAGGADELLEADFTYNVAELKPEVTYSGGTLNVRNPDVDVGVTSLWDMDDYRNEWDLRLNDDVPMDMSIEVGAGRSDLTLGSLALTSLGIETGAGEVTVDLTGAPSLTRLDLKMGVGALLMDLTGDWTDDLNANISSGVGELTLRLPGSVGVRVDVEGGLGAVSASNLAKDGDTFTNDAYGESEVTLRFDIEAGVGEINLESEPAPAAVQPVLPPELVAEIEAYIEQMRELLNVPGVAVVIVQGGEIVYAKGFGVKEIGSNDPVTADTVFTIGSLTKAMTSMMVASLVDDGLIAWDTPLVEVMPQFRLSDEQATQQITLREALGMTTGLPDIGPILFLSGRPPEDYVEYLADVPLAAPPGELYAYHSEMYSVGAYAATMAAGAEYGENLFSRYADLMQERVFDPLGMTSATFSAQAAAASPNHATPHFMSLNANLAETGFDVTPTHYMDMDTIAPAGTARMSATDVGRFLITMLSGGIAPDGSRAISAENLAETWTGQISYEPVPHLEQASYGMGWNAATYHGIPLATHDGNLAGFASNMAFIPEADTGIVVLTNADYLGVMLRTQVQFRLIEMLLGLEPFIDEGLSEGLASMISGLGDGYSQLAAVDPETVAPFLGSYDVEGEPYTVELRDDRLWVSLGEWDHIELLAAPDGSYVAISGGLEFIGGPFQFVEADDGRITMVIYGQLEFPKLD